MKGRFLFITLFLAIIFSGCKNNQKATEQPEPEIIDTTTYFLNIAVDTLDIQDYRIKRGETFGSIMARIGYSAAMVDSVRKIAEPVFDISKLVLGKKYSVLSSENTSLPQYLVYERNLRNHIVFSFADSIKVYEYNKEIITRPSSASGIITSSLWNAIRSSGNDIMLSDKMAEIYAWQVDFFGIAKGDNFRIMYDQDFIDDSICVDISNIRGAVFNHQGKDFYAIPFCQDSILEFFDENGQSLRKAFLKAPLKFSRISSTFSNARKHPVLKIVRPHHGVDYAAPSGTPVRTIGDGTVTKKGFEKGGGNFIRIRHNSSYETVYMHLSKFAKGLAAGQKVTQGDIIGYVGSTGTSTGPHLDFRVYFQGHPINPLKMESPAVEPVKPELLDSFNIIKDQVINQLKSIELSK